MALERFKNVGVLCSAVGLYLTGRAQATFRTQGRGSVAWPARGVPNRIGILLDLQQGRVPPERRFEARPAAIDTGRLRSSIAYRVSGNTVTVGSSLAYASDVQRGSTKTVTIDRNLRSALANWLKSLPAGRKQQMRRSFGFLFTVGSLSVTVPPRPFLILDDEDRRKINELATKFFGGAK